MSERVSYYGTGIANEKAARRYLRDKFRQRPLEEKLIVRAGARFYVSVRDGARSGFLLGPYASHMMALMNVARGRSLAEESSNRAWSYAFGTASALGPNLKTVFGR